MIKRFPFYRQYDTKDCGPTCLKMISEFHGAKFPLNLLREKCQISKNGVSLLGIEQASRALGFEPTSSICAPADFFRNHLLPCIVHWNRDHFIVVYKITNRYIHVADPAKGRIKYALKEFVEGWIDQTGDNNKGVVLFLEKNGPLLDFQYQEVEKIISFKKLYNSFFKFRFLAILLLCGIFIGAALQMLFPFLTKAILDLGVEQKSLYYISIILAAQLMLFFGQISIDFARRWILLFISTRINLTILTNFLQKLMKLPVSFFDTKHVGDMMQRLNDHNRIETFLTNSSVSSLFSIVTLLVFGSILAFYNWLLFATFLVGSILYVLWILLFLKKRKALDILRFELQSKNHSKVVELIGGMQDIKLNDVPNKKRWEWEQIQARLFNLNSKLLKINQMQEIGGHSLTQLKNIFIIFLSAKFVIDGHLTLGEMLATQYIVGQLNGPIDQLMAFIQSGQEAELSMDRLNEVHEMTNEELETCIPNEQAEISGAIKIDQVSFSYPGANSSNVLSDLSLNIEEGKITAIVGASGSGKTTLIKLLLMIYNPHSGSISIGDLSQKDIRQSHWRAKCGTVLQDGYLFSDSIGNNIALDENKIDNERLYYAASMANIYDYVMDLPLKFDTLIGNEGSGLSQGQKQRILIARSIYKNPAYIFFDEATNSLDATNESTIMRNLNTFFLGRTVVIVAHRLSTVKHAHKIVVLSKGIVVETGTHLELLRKKGYYHSLVKDQLELDQ
jgi:ATP-binding cassette subfamily B protein